MNHIGFDHIGFDEGSRVPTTPATKKIRHFLIMSSDPPILVTMNLDAFLNVIVDVGFTKLFVQFIIKEVLPSPYTYQRQRKNTHKVKRRKSSMSGYVAFNEKIC